VQLAGHPEDGCGFCFKSHIKRRKITPISARILIAPFQNFTGNAAKPLKKMLGLQRREWDGVFNRRLGKRLNRVAKAICPSMRANGAPKQK
jgi:hypothetical protein